MGFRPQSEDWKRSSFCEASGCVEVGAMRAEEHDLVLVRDTLGGPILTFTQEEWGAFIAGVKAGEFDL